MNQQGGVFDRNMRPENKETTVSNIEKKEDFKSPQQLAQSTIVKQKTVTKENLIKNSEEEAIENVNNALNGRIQTEEDLKELNSITAEDLTLAESLIFNGYAEYVEKIPNIPKHSITVCSTSPEELDLIEEMVFDLLKQNENVNDKTIDLPDAIVRSARNAYSLALSYKGMDGNDICFDRTLQLNILKKAIEKLVEYEMNGDIKGFKEAKEVIKKAIRQRSMMLKRYSTPVMDLISNIKYKFDQKMFNVMRTKDLIPKS